VQTTAVKSEYKSSNNGGATSVERTERKRDYLQLRLPRSCGRVAPFGPHSWLEPGHTSAHWHSSTAHISTHTKQRCVTTVSNTSNVQWKEYVTRQHPFGTSITAASWRTQKPTHAEPRTGGWTEPCETMQGRAKSTYHAWSQMLPNKKANGKLNLSCISGRHFHSNTVALKA